MVIDTPKVVHKVTGVQRVSDTHLRVSVLKDEQGLYLVASDAADGQAWFDALERACVWDVNSSAKTVNCFIWFVFISNCWGLQEWSGLVSKGR